MSTAQRVEDLIALLVKGTNDGSLKWQVTADEDTFRLASPTANIRLHRSEHYDPEAEDSYTERSLTILNDKARIIEEYRPKPTWSDEFDALFASARRSAYKTDEILDKLMKELRQSVP